ncbi:unnamed protein product, partial [Nesidiocoris tenuis]
MEALFLPVDVSQLKLRDSTYFQGYCQKGGGLGATGEEMLNASEQLRAMASSLISRRKVSDRKGVQIYQESKHRPIPGTQCR